MLYALKKNGQVAIKVGTLQQLVDVYEDARMGEPAPLVEVCARRARGAELAPVLHALPPLL